MKTDPLRDEVLDYDTGDGQPRPLYGLAGGVAHRSALNIIHCMHDNTATRRRWMAPGGNDRDVSPARWPGWHRRARRGGAADSLVDDKVRLVKPVRRSPRAGAVDFVSRRRLSGQKRQQRRSVDAIACDLRGALYAQNSARSPPGVRRPRHADSSQIPEPHHPPTWHARPEKPATPGLLTSGGDAVRSGANPTHGRDRKKGRWRR